MTLLRLLLAFALTLAPAMTRAAAGEAVVLCSGVVALLGPDGAPLEDHGAAGAHECCIAAEALVVSAVPVPAPRLGASRLGRPGARSEAKRRRGRIRRARGPPTSF